MPTAKTKTNTRTCPVCAGRMTLEKREDSLTYLGREKRLKVEGWWCNNCDEAVFEGPALIASERAFLELKAEVDGVLGPEAVARVREKLGLSQRKAGELLGGGPRAFQKYEAGKQAVSVPMSHLLALLAHDPSLLRVIKGAAAVSPKEKELSRRAPPAQKTQKKGAEGKTTMRKRGRSSSSVAA